MNAESESSDSICAGDTSAPWKSFLDSFSKRVVHLTKQGDSHVLGPAPYGNGVDVLKIKVVQQSCVQLVKERKKEEVEGSHSSNTAMTMTQSPILVSTLEGHTSPVLCVCFTPDDKYVVSGGEENAIKVWCTDTWQCVATLQGHTGLVCYVCVSPCNKYIVSCSSDETIKLWEIETWQCQAALLGHGHGQLVKSVCFTSDGKYLVSGSYDNTIKIWSMDTKQCVTTLQGHTGSVCCVSVSSDGRYMISASSDKTCKVWSTQSWQCIATLQDHGDAVWSVCFTPDSRYIVAGSYNKTIKIWSTDTWQCIATLQGHRHAVNSVCTSPCSKYVISGSQDCTIKIWSLDTMQCLHTLQSGLSIRGINVCMSHDGRYVVSGGHLYACKVWQCAQDQDPCLHETETLLTSWSDGSSNVSIYELMDFSYHVVWLYDGTTFCVPIVGNYDDNTAAAHTVFSRLLRLWKQSGSAGSADVQSEFAMVKESNSNKIMTHLLIQAVLTSAVTRARLKQLLGNGFAANAVINGRITNESPTALHFSLMMGRADLAEELIQHGASIDACLQLQTHNGTTLVLPDTVKQWCRTHNVQAEYDKCAQELVQWDIRLMNDKYRPRAQGERLARVQ